jgi:hypothetical protein
MKPVATCMMVPTAYLEAIEKAALEAERHFADPEASARKGYDRAAKMSAFQAGTLIRRKGKGEVLPETYLTALETTILAIATARRTERGTIDLLVQNVAELVQLRRIEERAP